MGQNSSPQTDSPKIVLFDLDDNLHEAEIWLFLDGLRHIFRAVGYEWRPYEKGADATLLPIERENEPGLGVLPLRSILHLLKRLNITPRSFSIENMTQQGFAENTINAIQQLLNPPDSTADLQETLAGVLEKERIEFFLQKISKEGIIPLPGYEVVQRLKEAGYKIGIVTSAPQRVAMAVLEKLGLITYENREYQLNGVTKIRRTVTNREINMVVGGNMAEEPKPSAAPLRTADWAIQWNNLTPEERLVFKEDIRGYKSQFDLDGGKMSPQQKSELLHFTQNLLIGDLGKRAYFHAGDSGSDVRAAHEYGIPVIVRRNEFTDEQRLRDFGATIFVDTYDVVTPEMLTLAPTQWEGYVKGQEQNISGRGKEIK